MKIKLSKLTYSLSEAIVMDIDYENKTTELITIEDPSKSLDVIMHVVDSKTNEDMSYTMGTIDVTIIDRQTDQYALSEPIVERIDISPEDSFHFTSDLNERLYLSPGKFDCFLTDQDAESNHLFATILFDNASVDTLYAIAIDPHQRYSRRE